MRILILNLMLYTTPTGHVAFDRKDTIKNTMIYNFLRGFVHKGHDVTLAAGEPFRPEHDEDYECKIEWFTLGFRSILPNGLMYPKGLLSYLRKNKNQFDVIISSDVFSFCSLFAAIICPKKLIIWHEPAKLHDTFYRIPAIIRYKIIVFLFIKKRVLVMPRSMASKHFLEQYCDYVTEPIEHPIDLDIFHPSNKKEQYFLTIAQLIYRKNVDSIIQKFSDFIKKYPQLNYRLLIAGEGEERCRLELLIRSLHLEDKVILLGFQMQRNLVEYLSHAVAMVCNTRFDYNMVSIPESIATGTPVLTNTVPYTAHYISSERLGISKDDWGADDLYSMIIYQDEYISNCLNKRKYLSSDYLCNRILEIYHDYSSNK